MNKVKYLFILVLSRILGRGNDFIVGQFRKCGMTIGEGTHIFSNIPAEPYLIEIGSNSSISTNVSFVTHDASVGVFLGRDNKSDLCVRIKIGNNCFIGNNSILLYGVSLPDRTLVASGSVVTKSVTESGLILGGNPARVIGRVDDFLEKNKELFLSLQGKSSAEKKKIILQSNKLVVR